nr:competence type IV pilus minor pilin ComGF [Bhargavaea ginsengi]
MTGGCREGESVFRTRPCPDGNHAATGQSSEAGYTFVEALLHLAIFSLFFILFAGFFRYSAEMAHHIGDPSSVEWELFRYELADYLGEVEGVHILDGGSRLRIITGDKVTEIGHYPAASLILKRVNDQGHEPMLTGVRSVRFLVEEGVLSVSAVFMDGKERRSLHHLLQTKK